MAIREYLPLNFAIMRHPSNWVTVILMVILAGIALDVILAWHSSKTPSE